MSTVGCTISQLVHDFKGCLFILFFVFCLDSHVTSSASSSHPRARRVCLLVIHALARWLRAAEAKTQVCTHDFTIFTSRENSFLQSSKTNCIIQVYFISPDIFVIGALFSLLMRNTSQRKDPLWDYCLPAEIKKDKCDLKIWQPS